MENEREHVAIAINTSSDEPQLKGMHCGSLGFPINLQETEIKS